MASTSDFEHAMLKFTKTFEEYKNSHLNLENFTDGWIFINLLRSAVNFKIDNQELV